MISPIDKYSIENPQFKEAKYTPYNPNIYSEFDAHYLYSVVREYKPKTILELGPRDGKTTSCIINGLVKNLTEDDDLIKHHIFEKDTPYLIKIEKYVNDVINKNKLGDKIQPSYNGNIIDSKALDDIQNVDFLFIDANHDYILARWYVEHLFHKVNVGGVICIHDIYYDKNNNGWYDARMSTNRKAHTHPDYTDVNTLKNLYPTIFDEYFDGQTYVTKHEADVIEEFHIKNKDNVDLFSTLQISRENGFPGDFNCSIYFKINKEIK